MVGLLPEVGERRKALAHLRYGEITMMELRRSELAVALVGALVWGGPAIPDPWPVVIRDGVVVHPEDLDR